MSQLLNVSQVASKLNVSERTVRSLERDGKLPPAIMIGSSKRWDADELDAFLKSQSK